MKRGLHLIKINVASEFPARDLGPATKLQLIVINHIFRRQYSVEDD